MPTCYFLALAAGSSLDQETNTWSLFTLIENLQVPKVPIDLPLETHLFWVFTPAELDMSFEGRLVIFSSSGREEWSDPFLLNSPTRYYRLRLRGIALSDVGEYQLSVEWRKMDAEDWTRAALFWPLTVRLNTEQTSSPGEVE